MLLLLTSNKFLIAWAGRCPGPALAGGFPQKKVYILPRCGNSLNLIRLEWGSCALLYWLSDGEHNRFFWDSERSEHVHRAAENSLIEIFFVFWYDKKCCSMQLLCVALCRFLFLVIKGQEQRMFLPVFLLCFFWLTVLSRSESIFFLGKKSSSYPWQNYLSADNKNTQVFAWVSFK